MINAMRSGDAQRKTKIYFLHVSFLYKNFTVIFVRSFRQACCVPLKLKIQFLAVLVILLLASF